MEYQISDPHGSWGIKTVSLSWDYILLIHATKLPSALAKILPQNKYQKLQKRIAVQLWMGREGKKEGKKCKLGLGPESSNKKAKMFDHSPGGKSAKEQDSLQIILPPSKEAFSILAAPNTYQPKSNSEPEGNLVEKQSVKESTEIEMSGVKTYIMSHEC